MLALRRSFFYFTRSIRSFSSTGIIFRQRRMEAAVQETANVDGKKPGKENGKQRGSGDAKPKKTKEQNGTDVAATSVEMNPWPAYINDRIKLWDKLKTEYDASVAAKTPEPIKISLPKPKAVAVQPTEKVDGEQAEGDADQPKENVAVDGAVSKLEEPQGKIVDGQSWRTTPYQVAQGISQGLADSAIVAKVITEVDGVPVEELWDLDRPLEQSCRLELLKFDSKEGNEVFWHSSAHILGEAAERHYGGCLCHGPPVKDGFFYDMFVEGRQVSSAEFPGLEKTIATIVKEKQPFERLEMRKEDLLEMFRYNPFKLRYLDQIKEPSTTVYRCGPLIDLCRGPHVRNTGKVKSMQITKSSACYWAGDSNAESLQRIYGISFPDTKLMKEWQFRMEEAAKRDHRKIGKEQELFFFHEMSPGSCFFHPRGAHVYNTLVEWIRHEYRKRGFQEVISPNMYNSKLWELSGHWQHYADNMFQTEVEKEKFALKPMNCPGHCLMFAHRPRSWRELPYRMADFGVLHRNELSGTLTGLTRVRRFQQDDAHIFCAPEQIRQEVNGALDFLSHVYGVFGFQFSLKLSTRPDKFLGEKAVWDNAEAQLTACLNEFNQPWELNPGDGAFYGPKIDITIMDALQRHHQCATIQLDFQLPIRFDLNYNAHDGKEKRPVIIHRAVLGSVERMIAILTESFGGKWPFWLSPRQACMVTVAAEFEDYAMKVKNTLYEAGFMCDADAGSGDTMNKKIRNAQLEQYNYILVVGKSEQEKGTVNVRSRDNTIIGEIPVNELVIRFNRLKESKSNTEEL
ncbi:hypothetical protein RvY_18561 [Ramazzottius varieornatus]|uniref:threonine--tRNA ligase n=1 Tax=Ramazzottius varieornatus TaxID=947166 RepID=A0A1D1W7Q7_RAMVA|nr:hypothetical protein RvY_18561 [Ramazzottius varieornatus]